jgi:hypothetical protein
MFCLTLLTFFVSAVFAGHVHFDESNQMPMNYVKYPYQAAYVDEGGLHYHIGSICH